MNCTDEVPTAEEQRVTAQINLVLRLDMEGRDAVEARELLNAHLDTLRAARQAK
jgi:hypothetical protein